MVDVAALPAALAALAALASAANLALQVAALVFAEKAHYPVLYAVLNAKIDFVTL